MHLMHVMGGNINNNINNNSYSRCSHPGSWHYRLCTSKVLVGADEQHQQRLQQQLATSGNKWQQQTQQHSYESAAATTGTVGDPLVRLSSR